MLVRCVVPPTMRRPSASAQRALADRLFRDLIRARGYCEVAGLDRITCNGNLQTAHLVSRRYLSVRWDQQGAVCACAAHHVYYTHHPLEWDLVCQAMLGPRKWEEFKRRAVDARGAPDYDAVIERLRGEVAQAPDLGMAPTPRPRGPR